VHTDATTWFFIGDIANPVKPRACKQHLLRTYIPAVMQHFPTVYAWDVVTSRLGSANVRIRIAPAVSGGTRRTRRGLNGAEYVCDAS